MADERELWFLGPRRVEVRPVEPLPPLAPGEVKARALFSGVSQGTELLLYRGEGPRAFDPSLDDAGAPTYPRRYGYSWVGEIVESRAQGLELGQRIFALRPHGDVHVLRPEQMRKIPQAIPSARATLAANLETALTVVWDAGIAIGDRVVVIGGGIVGLLSAMLAGVAGAKRVRVIEPSPRRRRAALELGIAEVVAPAQDVPSGDCDVVIEATGDPECLDLAIAHAGLEATVVVASFYGERRSQLSLGTAFHRRRLQLKASQVSRLPPQKTARWDAARRFATVVDLLRNPRLDTLMDPPIPFVEAPAWYARLDADPGSVLHSIFAYG
jgi:2-desacetyl-2-hydroxyethyl bacteriochlorophyllide A dehydrogenase